MFWEGQGWSAVSGTDLGGLGTCSAPSFTLLVCHQQLECRESLTPFLGQGRNKINSRAQAWDS